MHNDKCLKSDLIDNEETTATAATEKPHLSCSGKLDSAKRQMPLTAAKNYWAAVSSPVE